ncbi:MAG: hypothetical protein ACMUIU_07255 [bacterium]
MIQSWIFYLQRSMRIRNRDFHVNNNRLIAFFIIINITILINPINVNAQWMPFTGLNFPGALTQWPSYTGSLFSPDYSLFNFNPAYGNSFYSPFYPLSGSFSGGIYGGLYGGSYGGLYGRNYNLLSPGLIPSFLYTNPYISPSSSSPTNWTANVLPGNNNWWQGPPLYFPQNSLFNPILPSIIPVSQPNTYCDPASAPGRMKGNWSSKMMKDEDGNALSGELSVRSGGDSDTINMLDSYLILGEGSLNEFKYTRTNGKAPISFQGTFYSGYTANFTGTANNKLCCRNTYCAFAGVFEVEGNYVIKDKLGEIADKGTFKLKGPVSSSSTSHTPVDAIKALGKPVEEGREILSLTTGADGRIYGGTDIGCLNVGHMFIYDPATEETIDLGNPGYECNAMTTGKDGLIYLGGGTRSSGDHDCKSIGYANFAIYDPDRPWNPGQGSNANPRDLGQAVNFSGEVEGYPIVVHDLATAPNGKIYGCTGYRDGQSGEYYANLFVYDPQTDTIENLGQPISNQSSITRLAIAPDGIIYGVILGPRTGYRPPPGKLFSYDPASASFTMINTPSSIEGAGDLTVGADGLLYLAGNENNTTIFTYDQVSKSFDIKGGLGGGGSVLRMITAVDGIIYIGCAVNGYFVHYDPEKAWDDKPYSDANDKPGVNPRVFHWTEKVNALTEGLDGTIYFGNLSGQLFYFEGEE